MFTHLTGGRRRIATAAVVLASTIVGAPIRIGSQDQPRPTFCTEANYVRVDAYATTKDGAPIEDLRFRRADTLRVAVPASDSSASSARLLDRTGNVLQVPVPTSVQDEADGSKSHSATLALASLATSDYLIELIAGQSTGPPRTFDRVPSRALIASGECVACFDRVRWFDGIDVRPRLTGDAVV